VIFEKVEKNITSNLFVFSSMKRKRKNSETMVVEMGIKAFGFNKS
jgi:hypothetical protein